MIGSGMNQPFYYRDYTNYTRSLLDIVSVKILIRVNKKIIQVVVGKLKASFQVEKRVFNLFPIRHHKVQ